MRPYRFVWLDAFFGWWSELSPWWRYGVAVALLIAGVIEFFVFERLRVGPIAVGYVLLFFAGRKRSEDDGYRLP